jgi:hypothetical protein
LVAAGVGKPALLRGIRDEREMAVANAAGSPAGTSAPHAPWPSCSGMPQTG